MCEFSLRLSAIGDLAIYQRHINFYIILSTCKLLVIYVFLFALALSINLNETIAYNCEGGIQNPSWLNFILMGGQQ
jgi:hypothetical protein